MAATKRDGDTVERIPAGVRGVGFVARNYHPQPGAVVLGAGAEAEAELDVALEGTDRAAGTELLIVAVPRGRLADTEARVRAALAGVNGKR